MHEGADLPCSLLILPKPVRAAPRRREDDVDEWGLRCHLLGIRAARVRRAVVVREEVHRDSVGCLGEEAVRHASSRLSDPVHLATVIALQRPIRLGDHVVHGEVSFLSDSEIRALDAQSDGVECQGPKAISSLLRGGTPTRCSICYGDTGALA